MACAAVAHPISLPLDRVLEPSFPPDELIIGKLAPGDEHIEFCYKFGVGLTLLHSHDGVSEVCYFDNFRFSRPATEEDKKNGTPVSFYVDMSGKLSAYEWAVDVETPIRALPTDLTSLKEDLQKICEDAGLWFGITVHCLENGRQEIGNKNGQPGWHEFLPYSKMPPKEITISEGMKVSPPAHTQTWAPRTSVLWVVVEDAEDESKVRAKVVFCEC